MIEAHLNPDWYRVKYNLAALHANWSASVDADDEGSRAEALERRQEAHSLARELAEAALEQLVERPEKVSPALRKLLEESILPAALVLYGGTGSRMKKYREPGTKRFHLHDPPQNQRELLRYVRSGLNDHEALRYVTATTPHPSPRTLYNLACAHAQDGRLDDARHYLERALTTSPEPESQQLAQRAAADPTLRGLRDSVEPKPPNRQSLLDQVREALFGSEYTMEVHAEEEEEGAEAEAAEEEEGGPTATA